MTVEPNNLTELRRLAAIRPADGYNALRRYDVAQERLAWYVPSLLDEVEQLRGENERLTPSSGRPTVAATGGRGNPAPMSAPPSPQLSTPFVAALGGSPEETAER